MARTGPKDVQILRDAHLEKGWGERGYTLYERTTIRLPNFFKGIATSIRYLAELAERGGSMADCQRHNMAQATVVVQPGVKL